MNIRDSICRVCFFTISKQQNVVNFSDFITRPEDEAVTYLEAFVSCTSIVVEPSEPQVLCNECASELLSAFKFKEKCKQTQNDLPGLLQLMNTSLEMIKIEEINIKNELFDDDTALNEMSEVPIEYSYEGQDELKIHCKKKLPCLQCGEKFFKQFLESHRCSKRLKKGLVKNEQHSTKKTKSKRKTEQNNKHKNISKQHEKTLCPICGVLRTSGHIQKHLEKQTNGPKLYTCDICGSQVRSRGSIYNHMQLLHINILRKCAYCPEKFRTNEILDSHIRKIHPEIRSSFKCHICEFTTVHRTQMRLHKLMHTGKTFHKCSICQKEFLIKKRLTNHMAVHFDDRLFTCEICGTTYKTRRSLDVHSRVHRERDYECSVCHRAFLNNQLLTAHMKSRHPDIKLPPPGTIMSKSWRIKMAEKKLKEEAMRKGFDKKIVDAIVVTEAPPIEELQVFQTHKSISEIFE